MYEWSEKTNFCQSKCEFLTAIILEVEMEIVAINLVYTTVY